MVALPICSGTADSVNSIAKNHWFDWPSIGEEGQTFPLIVPAQCRNMCLKSVFDSPQSSQITTGQKDSSDADHGQNLIDLTAVNFLMGCGQTMPGMTIQFAEPGVPVGQASAQRLM